MRAVGKVNSVPSNQESSSCYYCTMYSSELAFYILHLTNLHHFVLTLYPALSRNIFFESSEMKKSQTSLAEISLSERSVVN